jgi:hypothetical protein
MERVRRVELPTLCLASIRSSQLSYTRMLRIPTLIDLLCQFPDFLAVTDTSLPQPEKLDVVSAP